MTRISLPIIALTLLVLLSAHNLRTPQRTDLLSAIRERLVSVKATSLGGNSEECVRLQVTNLTPRKLELTIPSGTLFNTVRDFNQDILVTRPTDFFVDASKTTTATAYGFCCEASKGISGEGDELRIQACSNNKLVETARKLGSKKYDPDLQQHTIWAVSDNHSIGGIWNDDREVSNDLRTFTAQLLGQPVPTYDVDYGYELNTPFVFAPKTIKGEMEYKVVKPGRASLQIFGPNGNLFQTFYENRHMISGNYKQRYMYTATGMEAGDYTVKLIIDGMEWKVQTIRL